MVIVLIYYCCVTNYHKCTNFRQRKCITHSSVGHKSGRLRWVLCVGFCQAGIKVLASLGFSLEPRGKNPFSTSIRFWPNLVFCAWKTDFSDFLPAVRRRPLSTQGHWISPSHVGDPILKPVTVGHISLCFASLWLLLLLAREYSLLLKGLPDWVKPTSIISAF